MPMNPPKNRIIEEGYNITNKDVSSEKRDKLFSDYYNKYEPFFNNIEEISGNRLISDIIGMKIIYIRILDDTDKKSEQNKARPICDQLFILLQRLDNKYYEYKRLYNLSLFWDGVVWSHLGKYKKSNKSFKELLKIGETTENNKKWYAYNLARMWNRYLIIFGIILLILSYWDNICLILGVEIFKLPSILLYPILFCVILCSIILLTNGKIFEYFINKKYK